MHRITVYLHLVRAVFQFVGSPQGLGRKLARLAHQSQTGSEPVCQCRRNDKSASFNANNLGNALLGITFRKGIDHGLKTIRA